MHIFAIGGGEVKLGETVTIDQEIILATGKQHPKLLFIPTASRDAQGYIQLIKEYFGKLGCDVDDLSVVDAPYSPELEYIVKEKIMSADIIYVGGGNTRFMLAERKKRGIDKALYDAGTNGTILSGLSAGAICRFTTGLTDSDKFEQDGDQFTYKKINGLGLINLMYSPHQIRESERIESLKHYVVRDHNIGIAVDDNACLEIKNKQYRIIQSQSGSKAQKLYIKDNKITLKELDIGERQNIGELISS